MSSGRQTFIFSKYEYKLRVKYRGYLDQRWQWLVNASKSTKHKYLDWLVRQSLKSDSVFEFVEVKALLECFNERKTLLKIKDINRYQSIIELQYALAEIRNIQSKKQLKRDHKADLFTNGHIRVVEKAENFILFQVLSPEGATFLGRNTKWCTVNQNEYRYYVHSCLLVLIDSCGRKYQLGLSSETLSISNELDQAVELGVLLSKYPQLKKILASRFVSRYVLPAVAVDHLDMLDEQLLFANAAISDAFYSALPNEYINDGLVSRIEAYRKSIDWYIDENEEDADCQANDPEYIEPYDYWEINPPMPLVVWGTSDIARAMPDIDDILHDLQVLEYSGVVETLCEEKVHLERVCREILASGMDALRRSSNKSQLASAFIWILGLSQYRLPDWLANTSDIH